MSLAHYKEAHPLPFVITHWINLVCMVVLILSGLYIHFPLFDGFMGIARGFHIACGFVILINCIVRVVMSLCIKSAQRVGTREGMDLDFKNFLPSKKNRHQFWPQVKFYLFMKRDHPKTQKYNSLQKLSYILIPVLILAAAFSGFCLWETTAESPFFMFFTDLVGGAMNMRVIHFAIMWVFVIFICIHVYLAAIMGNESIKLIFLHRESPGDVVDPDTGDIVGHDDLGGEGR